MILYSITKKLVLKEYSQVKIIIPTGIYLIDEFNQKMKVSIPQCVSSMIDNQTYKLIIPEHHTFITSQLLFDTLNYTHDYK